MPRPPLNFTTKVAVKQTLGECHDLLGDAGADAVTTIYEGAGSTRVPSGLAFRLVTRNGPAHYSLPVAIDRMAKLLGDADYPDRYHGAELARYKTREHAARVGWRVIKDWLEAQLTLIAASDVTLDEVMIPYLELGSGKTMRQAWSEGQFKAITA
jgi:hypothetical protein